MSYHTRNFDREKFRCTARTLVISAQEINQARTEYRRAVERLAGCPLPDWSMRDLERYVELGKRKAGLTS